MRNKRINQLLFGLVMLVSLLQTASAYAAPFTQASRPQPVPIQQQSPQSRGIAPLSAHGAIGGDAGTVPYDEYHEGSDSREAFEGE
jgi:hypothetical protein